LESAPADKTAGEAEEGFLDLGGAVVADEESVALVEPGEGALDDPAVAAEAGAVAAVAASDHRLDAALPDELPVLAWS
jgi:hypothetical protein